MNVNWMLVLCLALLGGCAQHLDDTDRNVSMAHSVAKTPAPSGNGKIDTPSQITNRFGMTFCLVGVDPARPNHEDSFPTRSYYLQETEFTKGQLLKYGEFAIDNWRERLELQMPNQWQEVADFAAALSAQDPDFDYRLPTRAQWTFACMNGYEQTCPGRGASNRDRTTLSKRPNKYGISGFMNNDLECSDVPGLFLGQYDDWNQGQAIPECRCHQVTSGNPGADDSLDELVVARFVLVPRPTSSPVDR